MHSLQKFLLVQLMTADRLRFSDLKPTRMESSKFTYHLHKLIHEGLVEKVYDFYALTEDGKAYAEGFDLTSLSTPNQPRTVVLIAAHDKAQGWLLSKRLTHPTLHMIGFPKVRVNLGKQLLKQSETRLLEMSGLKAELHYAGSGYITQYRDTQVESCVYYHLLKADALQGSLTPSADDTAELFWDSSPDWQDKNMIPSMPDLIKLLQERKNFFVELEYYL